MRNLWRRAEEQPARPQELPDSGEIVARDPRIEAYLTEVSARLQGSAPAARIQELREEMEAHLDALVEAYVELGSDPDAAVVDALRQFGSARRLSRQWVREGWRCAPSPSLALAFLVFLWSTVIAIPLAGYFGPASLLGWLAELLLPLIAGCVWGRRPTAGYRPLAAVAAVGLLASAVLPLVPVPGSSTEMLFFAALLRLLVWSTIACSGAGLTATGGVLLSRLRRRETA